MQISWWLRALHVAPLAQVGDWQSLLHSLFWHFSLSAHSELARQPTSVQATRGLPWRPAGQKQVALWLLTLHSARVPHRMSLQGSMHSLATQALLSGQSLSTLHSGSSDTTAEITCILRVRVLQGSKQLNLRSRHETWPSPINGNLQVHTSL